MSEYIIKNSEELSKYITFDLKSVQKEYADSLLLKLQEIEYENVYSQPAIDYVGYGIDDKAINDSGYFMYERTEDLYNLFQASFKGSNQYRALMSIIPMDSKLSHSWEDFQHASPESGDLTAVGYLNIIENGLPSNKTMFGERIIPRPFWKEFLDWMDSSHAKSLYETILKTHIKGIYSLGAQIS